MATESMRALIDIVFNDPDMVEALLDIQQFKLTALSRFSREDLEVLEESGFKFTTSFITQRRNELKTFLLQHPECMSSDYETLIDKITYYCTKQGQILRDMKAKRIRRAKELAEANKKRAADEESSSSHKPKKAPKKEEKEEDKKDQEEFHVSSFEYDDD